MRTSADIQNAQAHALVIEERKSPTLHQHRHATQMFEDAQKPHDEIETKRPKPPDAASKALHVSRQTSTSLLSTNFSCRPTHLRLSVKTSLHQLKHTSLWQQQHLHLSVCQPKHFTSRSQPNSHVSLSIKTSLSLSIRNSRLSLSNENTQPLSLNQNLTFLCQPKHFTSHVLIKNITSLCQAKPFTSRCQTKKHITPLCQPKHLTCLHSRKSL